MDSTENTGFVAYAVYHVNTLVSLAWVQKPGIQEEVEKEP